MRPSNKCVVCSKPTTDIPNKYKPILCDLVASFVHRSRTQSYLTTEILSFCSSCRISLVRAHRLGNQLSSLLQKRTGNIAKLSEKIASRHHSVDETSSVISGDSETSLESVILLEQSDTEKRIQAAGSAVGGATNCVPVTSLESERVEEEEPEGLQRNRNLQGEQRKVQQLSKKKFLYLKKYPFEVIGAGYQCGMCSAVCKFSNDYNSWHNITNHIRASHVYINNKTRQHQYHWIPFEVGGNLIQYGIYTIAKVGENQFKCSICDFISAPPSAPRKRMQNIREHLLEVHANITDACVCEICGKVIKHYRSLKKHVDDMHSEGDQRFPCRICQKTFKSAHIASVHEKNVHTERREKKFTCEVCGKGFLTKQGIEQHRFSHMEKCFKCSDCGKLYQRQCSLTLHQNSHTGRKKYACEVCGMNFSQKCNVTRHKRTAHSDRD